MKILVLLFLSAIPLIAISQVMYGPEAGINISNYNISKSIAQTSAIVGGRAGGGVDLALNNHLYLQASICYVRTGFSLLQMDIVGNQYSYSFKVNSLQLPAALLYKSGNRRSGRFFSGLGPYLGMNAGGKIKADPIYGGNRKIMIGSDTTDDIKRFDVGINIICGYQATAGIFIKAYYQNGFVNLQPIPFGNSTVTNINYGICAGYLLAGTHSNKKKKQ